MRTLSVSTTNGTGLHYSASSRGHIFTGPFARGSIVPGYHSSSTIIFGEREGERKRRRKKKKKERGRKGGRKGKEERKGGMKEGREKKKEKRRDRVRKGKKNCFGPFLTVKL